MPIMSKLRIIPLDDTVLFPGMPITLTADVGSDDRVLLVPKHENTYANVGVVAEVAERAGWRDVDSRCLCWVCTAPRWERPRTTPMACCEWTTKLVRIKCRRQSSRETRA
jgi:hypothetical protein